MEETLRFETRIEEEIAKRKKEDKIYHTRDINGKKIYPFVRFVWLDGNEQAFSYSHMTKVTFKIEDDINIVEANFTKELVTVKGYQLYSTYLGMINHTVCEVLQADNRYSATAEPTDPIVIEISLSSI